MSQRDQHSPYSADMLDGSGEESQSAEFGSGALPAEEDGEDAVTRVHNPYPSDPPAPWHGHQEVRPEQLPLHRVGFAGGSQAWRHGVEDWQSLQEPPPPPPIFPSSGEDGYESEYSANRNGPESSRRGFMFPRATGVTTASTVSNLSGLSSSRPPPVPDQGDGMVVGHSLPPPPRVPSGFPPPRYEDSAIHAEFHEPEQGLALSPPPAWLLRPPAALDSHHTLPPAVLDAYRGSRVVLEQRTIWFGLGATVALSAAVAALVSSLVWKLHAGGGSSIESAIVASVAAARPAETRRIDPEPESVPVDQLPLLTGARTPAPVTISAPERAERREARPEPARVERPRERDRDRERERERPPEVAVRLAEPEAPKAEAPKEAPREAAPAKPLSALDSTIAARLAQEEGGGAAAAPKRPERAPTPNGPADREGLARAVNQAAAAAQSCGTSPENGQVMVKFSPSGGAQSVQLLKPFSNHDVNACVLRAMSRARIAPFSGEAVAVRKSVRW